MATKSTVGIGAAARSLGTTGRALRYYEQRGLMRPTEVSVSGHRRYDELDLHRARRVLALRKLGLSLATIGKVLTGQGPEELTEVLTAQAQRIDAELNELSSLRTRLADLLTAASADRSDTATPPSRTEETLNLLEELAMKIVLSRIYTRTGDDGTTALAGGTRVDKTDTRLEVMGDVDELVSAIGVAIAALDARHTDILRSVQNDLFDLGADLASAGTRASGAEADPLVGATYITRLEQACDEANAHLDPPASFVLPGTGTGSAALHHARAICRRAERHSWSVPEIADEGHRYLNRLSDLLFILARSAAIDAEPTWTPSAHQPG